MIKLPKLPYQFQTIRQDINAMRGINYTDNYQDGNLAYSENVSFRRWPYMATGFDKTVSKIQYASETDITIAIASGTRLIYISQEDNSYRKGQFLYNDFYRGPLCQLKENHYAPVPRQIVLLNNKIICWPWAQYYDLDDKKVHDMAAKGTGGNVTFAANKITVGSGWADLTTLFKKGDTVFITGSSIEANNISATIKAVTKTELTFGENTFSPGASTTNVTIERKLPEMRFICAYANRLWGVDANTNTIFASAYGDPTNFYTYQLLETDSWSLSVGTPGRFTGCCAFGDSVLFWKEDMLHKIKGTLPSNFYMYPYQIDGVKDDCENTIVNINEKLFYLSPHGVCVYGGSTPTLISENFGTKNKYLGAQGASAGTDGEKYYLSTFHFGWSVYDWVGNLYAYDIKKSLWIRIDDTNAKSFAKVGNITYALLRESHTVVELEAGPIGSEDKWVAQFKPMYETINGKKSYSDLLLRAEIPKGSYLLAEIREDDGRWEEAGRVIGKTNNVVTIPLSHGRCDKFELRLSGRGNCAVLSIQRRFKVGSER